MRYWHFDVDSGSFMCDIGTLMGLSGTLMLAFNTFFFNTGERTTDTAVEPNVRNSWKLAKH